MSDKGINDHIDSQEKLTPNDDFRNAKSGIDTSYKKGKGSHTHKITQNHTQLHTVTHSLTESHIVTYTFYDIGIDQEKLTPNDQSGKRKSGIDRSSKKKGDEELREIWLMASGF